ncbi:hypothetical protein CC77DRAFT_591087 [Alternaria alternata]|uniref:Uncharacterized protein n=1 Tax=Alternaria alternata TaxID=5599 RepID=A0A177D372_ALTAL|nr:hypothetical protein CC77DRAFT_591087 [Alternaria alternata]OAG13901.1 hypothetical protein CC77DRAFT_591087 [Alternaria alternata]
MLDREPRGGRGFRRGKGLGRGKTQIWEWESYTPGAEVYEQLWRVRKEPAIVTARLPDDCPIPNARTRILYRRQTEDAIKRERYAVEITHISQPENRHDSIDRTEVEDVDFTRIMQYVSPAELERYETEQFRLEAEAEAVAIRTEAEDLARRQLHKNTKLPSNNRGSRMLSGLELPVILPTRARDSQFRHLPVWPVQPLLPTAPCLYHQYQRDFLLLFLSRDIQGFRIRIRTWA